MDTERTLNILKEHSEQTALDDSERDYLRETLLSHMEKHPVRERSVSTAIKPSGLKIIATIILILLLIGAGTSLAASRALPETPLYAVKIHGNEAVETLFTFTPESRARLATRLAIARLEEAETLQEQSKLTVPARIEIIDNFENNVNQFNTAVETLTNNNNSTAVAIANTDFQLSLMNHTQILDTLMGTNAPDASSSPAAATPVLK